MLHDRSAVVDCNDCGRDEVSLRRKIGALISCSTAVQDLREKRALVAFNTGGNFTYLRREQHLATLGLSCSNSVDKHFHSRGIVERAHKSAGKERISDGNRAVGFDELRDKLIVHSLMHVQTA